MVQKKKETIYMSLFTFMPFVQFQIYVVQREIELISKKSGKRKGDQKRKLIDESCESNIKTVI